MNGDTFTAARPMLFLFDSFAESCSEAPKNICAARSYRRVAAGCRTEAIDFIETKSECEQAANQFGLLPVHDVLRPSWAFGCMFNKNTSVPWFNHVGRKRIQPKDDELAICRNIGVFFRVASPYHYRYFRLVNYHNITLNNPAPD